jgi:hypothetical protein
MENPLTGIIVNLVKGIIKDYIKDVAKKEGCEPDNICLQIKAKNEAGEPQINVLKDLKLLASDIPLTKKELVKNTITKLSLTAYEQTGFSIDEMFPEYIQRFILRCCSDNSIPVTKPFFLLVLRKNEIYPIMYIDKIQKQVSLDYIIGQDEV